MGPRPVEQWIEILGALPSPNGESSEQIMADRILGELVAYPSRRVVRARTHDRVELANAMIAYARMMFDAGVRP